MSDSNQPVDTDESNLEEFENQFYGLEKKPDDFVDENEDNSLETEDDEPTEDDDEEVEEEEDSPDDEEEEEPEPEPVKANKKKSFQQRIDEITAARYEAEREAALLRQELDRLKTEVKPQAKEEKSEDIRQNLPSDGPNPDAVDDKGEPLYPLGEFDPKFISDLTRHTIKIESERARIEAEQTAAAKAAQEARDEIVNKYAERFAEVEKEVPEIRESVAKLQTQFASVPEDYGEYLALTIMSMENGPRLMHYLSQNIGEAQTIVASGPAAATLALGRLDARLSAPKQEEKRNKKIVSDAPPPPENRSRGANGRFEPNPDTDDLDAFERVFYKK